MYAGRAYECWWAAWRPPSSAWGAFVRPAIHPIVKKNIFVILSFLRKKQQKHEECFYSTLAAEHEEWWWVKLASENRFNLFSIAH